MRKGELNPTIQFQLNKKEILQLQKTTSHGLGRPCSVILMIQDIVNNTNPHNNALDF